MQISLRDQFAMHAPITMMDANESLHQNAEAARFSRTGQQEAFPMAMIMRELIRLRYEYADAMIAAGAVSD